MFLNQPVALLGQYHLEIRDSSPFGRWLLLFGHFAASIAMMVVLIIISRGGNWVPIAGIGLAVISLIAQTTWLLARTSVLGAFFDGTAGLVHIRRKRLLLDASVIVPFSAISSAGFVHSRWHWQRGQDPIILEMSLKDGSRLRFAEGLWKITDAGAAVDAIRSLLRLPASQLQTR